MGPEGGVTHSVVTEAGRALLAHCYDRLPSAGKTSVDPGGPHLRSVRGPPARSARSAVSLEAPSGAIMGCRSRGSRSALVVSQPSAEQRQPEEASVSGHKQAADVASAVGDGQDLASSEKHRDAVDEPRDDKRDAGGGAHAGERTPPTEGTDFSQTQPSPHAACPRTPATPPGHAQRCPAPRDPRRAGSATGAGAARRPPARPG